jgi:hypothetical protein
MIACVPVMFRYAAGMQEPEALTPATLEDLVSSLAFALRFAGRKRIHDADVFMSEQVARRLAAHLRVSGYVIMKRAGLSRGPSGKCE